MFVFACCLFVFCIHLFVSVFLLWGGSLFKSLFVSASLSPLFSLACCLCLLFLVSSSVAFC